MIGLMVLGALGLWLIIAIFLSKKIPQWLGLVNNKAVISVFIFPLILVIPIADELIGMRQFRQLCEKEAVVTLNPDWMTVKKALEINLPKTESENTIVRIYEHESRFKDIETGKIFLKAKWFATYGGLLRRHSGLANPEQCLPNNLTEIYNAVDIDKLIQNGESK